MNSIIPLTLIAFTVVCCKSVNQTNISAETTGNSVEGWDFCKCVVANDSITYAIANNKLTEAQTEKLMIRWEEVDRNCKEFTTFDNTTPYSRKKYEERVNECLKENGLK